MDTDVAELIVGKQWTLRKSDDGDYCLAWFIKDCGATWAIEVHQ